MGAAFLTAEWRDIVMLNYEAPPALLSALVPAGTELDTFQGKALVSVVGFRFKRTRVHGVPIPWHQDFEEVNLRLYVRSLREPERRGVVFVKEIVPRAAVTWVARMLYNENYYTHPMSHAIEQDAGETTFSYAFQAGGRTHELRATTRGPASALVPGSEEQFIAEHYYGYTKRRDGGTFEYRVDHPAWEVFAVHGAALDCDVAAVYGTAFAGVLRDEPRSALITTGSAVSVASPVLIASPSA
jgi:uncharacterized protein YqjF (DUF2071 family)